MTAFDRASQRIVSIVLNYNSADDIEQSVPQLMAQKGLHHTVLIVDNASSAHCVDRLRRWVRQNWPDAVIGDRQQVKDIVRASARPQICLVLNTENRGYSAGNNVGIELADVLQADAVLIANPDVRFESDVYVATLFNSLIAHPRCYVAGSRIVGLDGKRQSPLREPTFAEELFWPVTALRQRYWPRARFLISTDSDQTCTVPKVAGCCLMISMPFLRKTSYLDESVFLYCEEPILAARVRKEHGEILYVPGISAIHAHIAAAKNNPTARLHEFVNSRLYYLRDYSEYRRWQLQLLGFSYALLRIFGVMRHCFKRIGLGRG